MKNNKSLIFIVLAVVFVMISNYSFADEGTRTVQRADGSTDTIVTDSNGTQVYNDGKLVYSAGGDRSQEMVDQATQNGSGIETTPEPLPTLQPPDGYLGNP